MMPLASKIGSAAMKGDLQGAVDGLRLAIVVLPLKPRVQAGGLRRFSDALDKSVAPLPPGAQRRDCIVSVMHMGKSGDAMMNPREKVPKFTVHASHVRGQKGVANPTFGSGIGVVFYSGDEPERFMEKHARIVSPWDLGNLGDPMAGVEDVSRMKPQSLDDKKAGIAKLMSVDPSFGGHNEIVLDSEMLKGDLEFMVTCHHDPLIEQLNLLSVGMFAQVVRTMRGQSASLDDLRVIFKPMSGPLYELPYAKWVEQFEKTNGVKMDKVIETVRAMKEKASGMDALGISYHLQQADILVKRLGSLNEGAARAAAE